MARKIAAAILMLLVVLTLPGLNLAAAPAAAQPGVLWQADYFNHPYMLGAPVLSRVEQALQFNWGGGSPAPGVNADDFSARFAADIWFEPGTYRFYVLADDGVQLAAGPTMAWGHLWIDTYNNPRTGELLMADVPFPEGGLHKVGVSYRESTGDAYLYVSWERLEDGAAGPEFQKPVSSMGPWTAQYYPNAILSGNPVITATETVPTHDWHDGSPAPELPTDGFSARYSLVRDIDAGTYTITVRADDGVRVYRDGVLVIDQWHGATGETYTHTFTTGTGYLGIVIEYYESTGSAYLQYSLSGTTDAAAAGAAAPAPITGAAATITAWGLRVRSAPYTGKVLLNVNRGEVYPIVGRTDDSDWWQINVDGTLGWVSHGYVNVTGTEGVPVTW